MTFVNTVPRFRGSSLAHFSSDHRADGLVRVLDWLAEEAPQHVTLSDIVTAGQVGETSDALTSALWVATVLSTGSVPVLDLQYVFIDDEGSQHVIAPQAGMNDGTGIIHPLNGDLVSDWQDRTSLRFTPAQSDPDESPSP